MIVVTGAESQELGRQVNTILHELLSASVYKRSQGRITRQITFAAVAFALVTGMYRLHQFMGIHGSSEGWSWSLPTILAVVGLWLAYRLVNIPVFADFLIAVEAEMNKVSWPTQYELVRSSFVVLITMAALTIILWAYDTVWQALFRFLHIV